MRRALAIGAASVFLGLSIFVTTSPGRAYAQAAAQSLAGVLRLPSGATIQGAAASGGNAVVVGATANYASGALFKVQNNMGGTPADAFKVDFGGNASATGNVTATNYLIALAGAVIPGDMATGSIPGCDQTGVNGNSGALVWDTTVKAAKVCDGFAFNSVPFVHSSQTTAPQSIEFGTKTLATGAGTVTFATAYSSAPVCTCTDQTAAAAVKCSTSTTTLTIAGTSTDVIAWICIGAR